MNSAEPSYGIMNQEHADSEIEQHLEELRIVGFTILTDVLSSATLEKARTALDSIYATQESELGKDFLRQIKEENLARCPLAYDEFFLSLATNSRVLDIAGKAIGGSYITLHLQNGIINRPSESHHQSSWHRDLPYQEYTISKPLALGALYCIDDFTVETGCTYVLPHSHRVERMPSPQYVKKHELPAVAEAGSVIMFDAMLYHRAGYNSSNRIRRGINNVLAAPLLKQQIDLPVLLGDKYRDDPFLSKFLGYQSSVPASVREFREARQKKLAK